MQYRVSGFAILYAFIATLFLSGIAFTLENDYSLECNPGYKLASFRRSPPVNNVVGSLTIECEPIESDLRQVKCERLQSVPQCSGVAEGCSGEAWIGGFHAYVIENVTETVLLEPICCSSKNIQIDETSCVHDRINSPLTKFDHSIAYDMVYRGMQCWHQYNGENILFDLVWKTEICSFVSPNQPSKTKGCRECDCKCGIERCTNYRYPIRIVHKHHANASCECSCDCDFKCF